MEDLILRGGTVMDGTGNKGYRADVAVTDGRISAMGDLAGLAAKRELSAEGMAVAPGFFDSHAHSDLAFLKDSSSASKLFQGITTEVTGQCGSSPFPALREEGWQCGSFDAFVKRFEGEGHAMAVNQAILEGHGSLRAAVMGYDDRKPTPQELIEMQALLRRDLEDGAWGLSLGLEYAPGIFADAEELNVLGAVAAETDAIVTAHMRSEGLAIDEAIDELTNIGRATGARVHISHLKLDNFRVHGRAEAVWARIEAARAEGVRLSCDMYPYTASCTGLSIRCPRWSRDGGTEALLGRLKGPERAAIVEGIREHYFSAERAETCLFIDEGGLWPEIKGKTLRFVAEELLHTRDYAEAAAKVLERTRAGADCIFFVMSEADMLTFLKKDVGIGSDGYALPADPEKVGYYPHPRSFGTVPEFFRRAREGGFCTVEEAVRRVTSKAADMLGMKDRGRLAVGSVADITVFDPESIAPRATYLDPIQRAAGVRHVLISGIPVLEEGKETDARPGRFLRRSVK